ncbi:MAG: ABC-2 transporter permease [Turicibacter sp.]|nr:ABC-2 transporter permease [Turicibacter sp.]
MKGLILKDLLNLKKAIKTMLIVGIAYSIFFSTVQPTFLTGILTLLFSMQSLSSFSYDEYAKWDSYALTFPISRKDLILSKYILFMTFPIIGSVLSIILSTIIGLFKQTLMVEEIFASAMGFLFSMEILFLIILPLIFKFGIERGRIMITIVGFSIFGILFLVIKLIQALNLPFLSLEQIYALTPIIPWIALVMVALIAYLSYQVSLRIVEKKEY